MLQLGQYKLAKGYLKAFTVRYVLLILLNLIINIICTLLLDVLIAIAITIIGLIIVFVAVIKVKRKTPLVFTYRIMRLLITVLLLNFALTFVATLWLIILAQSIVVLAANYGIFPIQLLINNKFINQARKKLIKRKDLIIIGITGSYGKTSVKTILYSLLSSKFNVVSSPSSYNTPLGLSLTVNKYLKDNTQVLICEMGARRRGEINRLCKIVNPQYAILTGIGQAHMATFKCIENIVATKSELLAFLPVDGYAIINSCDDYISSLTSACKCKYTLSGINKGDIYAANIVSSSIGTTFDIIYEDKSYSCSTRLLGEHNVNNIMLAVSLCLKLNIPIDEIIKGIKLLEAVPHRLQLINGGNCVIIDDSYNANVKGVYEGIRVLNSFSERKIVISCGIVELGSSQYIENYQYAKELASVCDVILCYGVNSNAIYEGAISFNYAAKCIKCNNLDDCMLKLSQLRQNNDCIMFTNDLTDDL